LVRAQLSSELTPPNNSTLIRIDVNYGGSSGYGRLYRDRLAGQWGVLDVEDCIECVRQLGSGEGGLDWIDASKVAIRGSSSG
jgi:dipeptidyl aminopeptidase/acylaminoacyl peptidase